jgi:hypothetical protein
VITNLLLHTLHLVLSPVLSVLPQAGDIGATTGLGGWLGAINNVVAITGPLTLIGLLLGCVPVFLAVRVAVWLYRLVPGKFT